jgi:subtilisin family serine protease
MPTQLKEYIVTAPNLELTNALQEDLTSSGSESSAVPAREVEVADPRPLNERNTSYLLTEEEAAALKNDPRVQDLEEVEHIVIAKRAIQDGTFDKLTTQTGEKQNWGLLRHINFTNNFGTVNTDPGGTYDYVLDGTGVDIVIVDSGIQSDHPEFQDINGVSRVQQIDWFTASGVPGTMPAGFYADYDGHGTHVAATVAGKTFGWAKNSNIYSIKLRELEGPTDPHQGLTISDTMDCILGWHNNKGNQTPTVVVNSWGTIIYWDEANDALTFDTQTLYPVTGGSYRGDAYTDNTKDPSKGLTGQLVNSSLYTFNYQISAIDADIEQLINAGIVVCNAAGNGNLKSDNFGGADYNNYVTATGLSDFYYHRGASPNARTNPGFQVGAFGVNFIGGVEAKSVYSDSGPNVSIYAAGDRILSAMSTTNIDSSSFEYYLDGGYKQQILSGTSMATPQVAGMCALLLQVHPDWSPRQVYGWVVDSAPSSLFTTNQTADYASTASVRGGPNKIAYFPMSGQRPYQVLGE